MKRKQILIGGVIVVVLGLGIYALVKSHSPATSADDEAAPENVPSIVTVQLGALKQMTLHRYVSGYGMVEAAPATADQPAAGSQLAAPSAGVVTKVNIIAGQQVQKGEVLAELNSGAATFDSAQAEAERQKTLYAQQNTSLKNLQAAEAQLTALEVVAPLAGTVTRLNVKPGDAVDVNMPVAEVIDLRRLAVSAEIPAADAADLKTGQEVQVQSETPVTTTLSFVSPAVDPKTGAVMTWAPLPENSGLRPGQFVQLKIITAVHTNCLAAPSESVVTDESGKSVLALVNGDAATQTPVQTGLRENGWVEITGTGIKEGTLVVTVGAYGLPEKTKIRALGAADEATATNSTPAK
jgi:multidrug efflux pump subunit AcrA (membrane-fusion protein)